MTLVIYPIRFMMITFKNFLYYLVGLIFMVLNKVRHEIEGYKTPRPFSVKQYHRCIEYDFNVVETWLNEMNNLTSSSFSLEGKNILELGPGAELGVGLILLAKGAGKYNALDVNFLVKKVPTEFYDKLFKEIKKRIPLADINDLKFQLQAFYEGRNNRLNYIYDKNFSFSQLKSEKIDVVFSHAAFEHFNNIEKTFGQLSQVVKKDGYILSVIDFQTHTRWIREKDPLNIYRYSDKLYNFLSFQGSPNRLGSYEYISFLKKFGWGDIKFLPIKKLSQLEVGITKPYLYGRFNSCSDIDILSGVLFAKKYS